MRRLFVTLSLFTWCALPAAAGPMEKMVTGVAFYAVYSMVAVCLVGWSFLVTALVRPRVELTARLLQKRPLASFFMGLASLGWLLLSLIVGNKAGGIGGVLVVATFSVLILCSLVGMPAILYGLGDRVWAMTEGKPSLPKKLLLGSLVLFSAGGFPWLGQLLLLGVLVWSCGGAVLGFFAGEPADAVVEARADSPPAPE